MCRGPTRVDRLGPTTCPPHGVRATHPPLRHALAASRSFTTNISRVLRRKGALDVTEPAWLANAELLGPIGGWPELAGGMTLGPSVDKANGDRVLRVKVVHPPGSHKTVADCRDGDTALLRLRFGGVIRVDGHRSEVFDLFIETLVVRRVPTSDREHDDQTDSLRQFEFLNDHGERLLLIEARHVTVESVQLGQNRSR